MADPRAFISFDFDNNSGEKLYFAGQIKNPRTPFNASDWSSKRHLPEKEWEDLIDSKINVCNVLIVLVGKQTYNATGVKKEIGFAKKNNVPIIGVYVGGADSSTALPEGLARSRVIIWGWDEIKLAIDQAMREGKNK
jgi:hypothetical protein